MSFNYWSATLMVKRPLSLAFKSTRYSSLKHSKSNELGEDDKPAKNSATSLSDDYL